MFEPFQKFLARSANSYGIGREVKAAQVCHNFRELVQEMFAEKSFPENDSPPASYPQDSVNIPTFGKSESKPAPARETAAPRLSTTPRASEHLSLARGPLDQFISSGSFQDGLLTVDVASPAWAQEVLMRKPQIITALNRKAGLVIVKNLRTRIKQS